MKARAWMTATRVIWHSDDSDDYTEEHGWVDDASPTTLEGSRNYVKPVSTWDSNDEFDTDDYPTAKAWVDATVSKHLGAADDNGDGTYYGTDNVLNRDALENGASWTYALHFEEWMGTTNNGTAGRWDALTV